MAKNHDEVKVKGTTLEGTVLETQWDNVADKKKLCVAYKGSDMVNHVRWFYDDEVEVKEAK
jgi:hypothetical protein